MKKFLIKLSLFTALISLIILFILTRFGGYVDYFYEKVSAPRQHSLIVGDSRTFQGVQPSILKERLASNYEMPILNFSFTLGQMAYGEDHLRVIKGKIDPETKNGLFILSVHPWIFSERDTDDIANNKFFESELLPHNLNFVSVNPNLEHFFRNFDHFHFKALIKRNSLVHKDGWLEESYLTNDTATLADWREKQIKLYRGFSEKWKKSAHRMAKFEETVRYLEQFGTVVLVRLPVDPEILKFERGFWPEFDSEINRVSKTHNSPYFNFSESENYNLYDGLHLDKKSGALFTKAVADSIKTIRR